MKVTGPMFSLDASGSIGGVLTASKWKGRNYFRALVKPANPKSALQISTRAMFKFLAQNWAALSSADKATWQTIADQIVASPFNAYMKENQTNWRNFLTPMTDATDSRSETADALTVFTATAGVRQVTIDVTVANVETTNWGFILFRALTAAFTPAVSNVHAVVFAESTDVVTFVDTPLEPDTYYYNAKAFTYDGAEGALDGEINAVVT